MTDARPPHNFDESGKTEAAPNLVNQIVYQTVELVSGAA
jgi:hypothetical protein